MTLREKKTVLYKAQQFPFKKGHSTIREVAEFVDWPKNRKLHGLSKMLNLNGWQIVSGRIFSVPDWNPPDFGLTSCIPKRFETLPLTTRLEWLANELLAFGQELSKLREQIQNLEKIEKLTRQFVEENGGRK